jgi:DNA-binding transcriptional MerR regulator
MAKLLYSMGEVTEMFDVNASLIRYWESKFNCIKPHKNKKGNRMFTQSDVENLKLIYHLVKEKGMTLEGANKAMSRRGSKVKQEVSVLERLQNIRAMLIEIRETLGDNSPVEYEAPINAVAELISDVEDEAKREVVAVATEVTTDEPAKVEEEATPEQPRRRGRPRKSPQPEAEEPQQPAVTRRRKSKRDDDNKELFPFYEQSLF